MHKREWAVCVCVLLQPPSRQAEMWNMPAVQKGQRFLDNQAIAAMGDGPCAVALLNTLR